MLSIIWVSNSLKIIFFKGWKVIDNSIILNQVENGVAIRMAVIYLLAKKNINHWI